MQHKKTFKFAFFALVILLFAVVATAAFIANSPVDGEIAKNCIVGQQNSSPALVWESALGGKGDDRAFCAANVGVGFVVVGSSSSFVPNQTVAWIVKLDAAGDQVWNRTFYENAGMEFRWVAAQTDGFLVVGNTFLSSGNVFGVVMKLDVQGTQVWNVTLGECVGVNKLFGGAIQNGIVVAAGLVKSQNASSSSGWLVKLAADGLILWSRTLSVGNDVALRGVAVASDGCFVAAGYVDIGGAGNYDFLAVKTDASGALVWQRTYGGAESDMAYSVSAVPGGCVLAGSTYSFGAGDSDAWVIKIGSVGNMLWNRTVGGKGFDSPSFIGADVDGGFVVAGTTFSFGSGYRDFWLFKIGDAGNVAWSCTVGRSGYEEAYAVVPAGQDSWVVAGWTNSIGSGGRYDFYVVKVVVQPN